VEYPIYYEKVKWWRYSVFVSDTLKLSFVPNSWENFELSFSGFVFRANLYMYNYECLVV